MMEFTNLFIEGFCSIPQLELPLNTKGITVIRGANGFGKSTIFSALVWVIYGKNIKGNSEVNTWKKFQPKNYAGTRVELFFMKDNQIHRIIRCYNYKLEVEGSVGGSKLIYQIEGSNVGERGKKNVQDIITKNIGMSYNLFLNSILFGQGLKRLIQESGTNQRDIFEEIFELGFLTKAKDIAYKKYKEVSSSYDLADTQYKSLSSQISILEDTNSQLSERESNFETQKSRSIKALKVKLHKFQVKSKSLSKQLEGFLDDDSLENLIQSYKRKISKQQDILGKSKATLSISLEDLINQIIELLESKEYDNSLKKLRTLQEAFKTQETCKTKISKYNTRLSKVSTDKYKRSVVKKDLKYAKDQVEYYKAQIQEKETEDPDFNSLYTENLGKIKKLKKEVCSTKKELDTYSESRDIYKWAYTEPLGSNGIKSYLFESCLHQLNEILETYSEVLGFSIKFDVDLTTTRKDFKTILHFEGQEVPYEDLSGGQKQLVNLAMAFSMNTLMSQAHGINIAFLDEVFESLSSDNIEIVINLIKIVYKDKTLFLITHQDSLPISNSRVLRVKREKGLSIYE